MDLRKDIDYVMNHKLGLDDTFQFRCKGCGKCCTHREDVLLTAYDLFRIARYFGRSPAEILSRYCEPPACCQDQTGAPKKRLSVPAQ